MKLINVDSLDIEEFFGKTPPYAILSHTWGDEEVTYQEWRDVRCNIIHKAGYKKILGARAKARKEGIRYLWCDTSCIDKTNSAELSEAINSMFAWYRTSQVCYAYLADVPPLSLSEIYSSDSHAFGRSRWFTRGWTLQELIAPPKVLFYAQDWTLIGPSTELASSIAKVCHIDETVFTSKTTLQSYSIANRMSWAAGRQTSRVEDEAYCLLGIFDIHMPLLYGEGPNAFRRLQEEIMKVNTDLSILVWTLPAEDDDFHNKEGWLPILAPSPAAFKHSGTIVPTERVVESTMSNRGLSLNMPLIRSSVPDLCYGLLPCWDRAQSDARGIMDGIWIPLSISRSNLSTGRYLFRPRVSTTWMCLSTIDATYHALRCASPVWIVENRFTQQYETLHPDFIDAAVESVPAPGRAAVMFLAPDYPGPNAFGWSGAYDYNLNNKWTCEPRLVTSVQSSDKGLAETSCCASHSAGLTSHLPGPSSPALLLNTANPARQRRSGAT